jgi:putative FmdB family regulatory protein
MPIYDFECRSCGERFERLQKLSDADPTVCPHCGKEEVKRRLTAPAFRLAGSGWYETDFKKEGDVKRNLAGKDDAPPSTPAADAKPEAREKSTAADSTPATPAPAKPKPAPSGTD